MSSRSVRMVLSVALILSASGCTQRPRAPALQDEPIYQNTREGFRFVAPEGWRQFAKADLPAGPVERERLLVRYMPPLSARGSTLEVSLADLPDSTELADYLSGPSLGVKQWKPLGKVETVEVNGKPATRVAFSGRVGKDQLLKEVTAFRRGGRVYFFTALVPKGDNKSRETIRRAVASTTWKN
jgi:hypothetical protein